MAVEVKTTLKVRDVDRYLSVLEGFGEGIAQVPGPERCTERWRT